MVLLKKGILFAVAVCLVAILSLSSCVKQNTITAYTETWLDLFDTATQLTLYADSREQFEERSEAIYLRLMEYHQLYDVYHDYNWTPNLKTINDKAGQNPVLVDRRIIDLLSFGKEVYTLSEGRVNIAYGAVLSLWHDARSAARLDPENAQVPSASALEAAARHTDIACLQIDKAASTVFLTDPAMRLDVGAIAKGYAVEQVCRWMEEQGWSAVLSAGGNVRTVGYKAEGKNVWRIAVEDPIAEAYAALVGVAGESVVTSGDYQRYFEVDGKRYAHIIDPHTHQPAAYVRAVTVIAKDSGLADALSTTLFLMSAEEGRQFVSKTPDVEAMWTLADGSHRYSDGFDAFRID